MSCDTGGVDPSPPRVVSTIPFNGATGIDYNYADFDARFSEEMASDSSYTVSPAVLTDGRWSSDQRTFNIVFQESLDPNTTYTISLNPGGSGTAFQDADGTPLASDTIFTFSTGATTNQPVVLSSVPSEGATDVSTGTSITLNFSQAMTTDGFSFNLNPWVAKTYAWTSWTTFVITPTEPLQASTMYTLTLNPVPSWQAFKSIANVRLTEYTNITFSTAP